MSGTTRNSPETSSQQPTEGGDDHKVKVRVPSFIVVYWMDAGEHRHIVCHSLVQLPLCVGGLQLKLLEEPQQPLLGIYPQTDFLETQRQRLRTEEQ